MLPTNEIIFVSVKLEQRKIEIQEANCRRKISQCKEDIRRSRTSIAEMRDKVKQQKEIRAEKE